MLILIQYNIIKHILIAFTKFDLQYIKTNFHLLIAALQFIWALKLQEII